MNDSLNDVSVHELFIFAIFEESDRFNVTFHPTSA